MYGDGSKTQASASDRPLPVVTPLNEAFWAQAARSVFTIQTCTACGDAHVPESPVCPNCLSTDQAWRPAAGTGTLESWCDFHRAYWDGFRDELPYRVGLVRLAEGPLYVARLGGEAASARLGAPVRVAFERLTDTVSIPYFELA